MSHSNIAKSPPKSNFLHLPRELRDIIYTYLQHSPALFPKDPDHAGPRLLSNRIHFEARSPRPALLQLKLCNRQLHAEVNDVLQRSSNHDRTPAAVHLDIMVRASSIWPTWISLPPTPNFDAAVVHVTLRLFEAAGWGSSEFSTGAYRCLWSLFNFLVSAGPCLMHNRHGGGRLRTPLRVGRLRFDIVLCSLATVDDLFGTYRGVFDRVEKLAFDNVGLGNVESVEACLGAERRVWRLRQMATGLTLASRIE